MSSTLGRVLVLIPTYNEKDSLPGVIARLRAAVPSVDILVLDDNSPDGTGAVADALAADDPQVRVLHREGKQGLGRAYLAGFEQAMEQGYDAVVEMDADGSHQPEQLDRLLAAAQGADVVIGSRWVPGGATHNWPHRRNMLSRGANVYTRAALGLAVRDATAGYRLYRTSALRAMDLEGVASAGYCFQVDLTLRAADRGLRIVEVPIDFVERTEGTSKMDGSIVREALGRVTLWGLQRRGEQVVSAAKGFGRRMTSGATWHELTD
ncbi:polyprenol monophosphomannose synthase [Ornithinimicrobium murale]|uniref:polyprenol monophosphomannose synthase n=1 Tax=Ornithinimicrobium murale TaxID=1050153 RepID=UPI000E0D7E52|nr:polyprenol monophosphomannose synthase [Ornithinimicrobium murale]